MGTGHIYRCKCRKTGKYINVGIGMMYSRVCDRVQKNMLAGAYGESWKKFLEEHPGGAFDCEKPNIEIAYKKFCHSLLDVDPFQIDEIMSTVAVLCMEHERSGFIAGIKTRIQLIRELAK